MQKILFVDIETAPDLGYTWGKWEQNVIEFKRDWYMLSFAAKWQGGKTKVYSLPDYENYDTNKEDDKLLCEDLWKLFDEADVIIAHNGAAFDIKKSNARFIIHGLTPPSPYKVVDTLQVARRYFKFDSNKLDDLAKYFSLKGKLQTGGFATWKGCMEGNMESWKKMCKYNKQDVDLLEKVYLKLRPWILNHPRTTELGKCTNCGSSHLQKRGTLKTKTNTLQRLQCQGCGAWSTTKYE